MKGKKKNTEEAAKIDAEAKVDIKLDEEEKK